MPLAIRFHRPGGPDVLHVVTVPRPQPGPGELRIEVHAAGVNNADVLERQGRYPVPPDAPPGLGLECAGVISAVGSEVDDFSVGDRVCALLTGGGYAEEVVVAAGQVMHLPADLTMVQGAALPEVACTVYSNLAMIVGLEAGQTVLVHGGAGGIGSFAVQWAAAIGARVIATAGGARKGDAVLGLGASVVVDYRTEDFVAATLRATRGEGADAILDIVGAPYLERNIQALGADGHLVTIGGSASPVSLDLWSLMSRRASLSATLLRARPSRQKYRIVELVARDVLPLVSAGAIRPVIDSVFPLAAAPDAHRRLESGDVIGKVMLETPAGRP